MNARKLIALFLMAGVMVIDGYDLNSMALAMPAIAGEMGLQQTDFAWALSAVLLGLGAGAFLIAPLGDRFGRKPIIVAGALGVAATTAATALSTDVMHFAFWRLLTGLALGACLANVSALSSEVAPEGKRSTVMAVVSAGIAVGAMLGGFTAPEVIRAWGWQGMFFIPAGIALVLGIGLAFLLDDDRPAPAAVKAKVPLVELFRPPLVFPMALFAAAYMTNAIALYMLTSWTVRILPPELFGPDLPKRLLGLMQGAGLPVSILLAWLLDRWKPGTTLALGYAIIAAAFALIFVTPATVLTWTILLMIAGGGIAGIHGALMALSPKLFPSNVLSSAIGTAVAVSRIGAIAAPIFGAKLIEYGITPNGYFGVLIVPAAVCGLIILLVPNVIRRTKAHYEGNPPALDPV
ncbi:MAG: MFS transporter [Candidatus Andeanibacterium colombiense]|uniref:MFS transporter n=1 Tax=Candidatus Andeanibacterium colombiense TaxID=3121345 RepID=A0AAJ5X4L6_9SPHN|nr:MAG: MFS transporter [Sphingomonadaceae bacterium]